ncbi:hypothetical protein [Nonomuraea sp. 10N515B]|uniref:hypothetical protein n=1 Tax=Nonomuraea sp. 10N515B TaxID=3457422 RepID=UPI003FCC8B41
MRFPIDTSQLGFTVTSPPTAAKDFTTKKVRVTDDGRPVMVVNLLAMDGTDSTKIKFNLPGEQLHLTPGLPVRVEGLCYGMARDGEVRWWSADAVIPLNAGPVTAQHVSAPAVSASVPAPNGEGAAATRGRNPHASATSARHGAPAGEGGGES